MNTIAPGDDFAYLVTSIVNHHEFRRTADAALREVIPFVKTAGFVGCEPRLGNPIGSVAIPSCSPLVAAAERPHSLERPPGVLTLGESGDIVETSETAERWLDTLPAEQILSILVALWARTRNSPLAQATVVGSHGPITFHCYPLKGSMDETAVVVERSGPAALAEVIIAAHGLTPRETDVTRRVMHGLSTRLIASDLDMSEYTVQDHLRSVFSKFDVSSRAELMSAMYAHHYLPAIERDATPGPYGWFLQP